MSSPDDLIIRPVLLQDAEALWTIARQEGVIETTMALPSLRLEQRMKSLSELGENDHCMVAERAGKVAGVAGLTVGTGRVRHTSYIYCPADPRFTTLPDGTQLAADYESNLTLAPEMQATLDTFGQKLLEQW
jgi:putative acetyltransferase